MKRVVLLLPDKITHVSGTSRLTKKAEIDLNPENLLKVLCEDVDYHESYKFSHEDVTIVSIETIQ